MIEVIVLCAEVYYGNHKALKGLVKNSEALNNNIQRVK